MYEYFEKLLKERGIKTSDVSKETGIPQQTFSAWKRRKGELTPKNLKKVAEYFGVSMDYFANGKTEQTHETPTEADVIKEQERNINACLNVLSGKTVDGMNILLAGGNQYNIPQDVYDFVLSAIEKYRVK